MAPEMALTDLIGHSLAIVALREQISKVLGRQRETSRRSPPILLLGETGTGKGLVASTIHREGVRSRGPFIDVNCAAIPETLLEAELFGWERGAFTDARQPKPGLFQAAHGGTIFLDEVGLLPAPLQSKFLKVIEEQQVRRLGSTRSEVVDVGVIAATSEDLDEAIRARRFREDLYHRLAVVTLRLPPLRKRGDDILLLAEHFLARACRDYGLEPKTLTADARAALLADTWSGNVRQLANVMERAALFTDAPTVTAEALGLTPAAAVSVPTPERGVALEDAMRDVERAHLVEALADAGGNITRAASKLGLPRNTLRYRLARLGLEPDASPSRRRGGRPPASFPRPELPIAQTSPLPEATPSSSGLVQEVRRLTLLSVVLVSRRSDPHAPEMTRALEAIMDKARSFGGFIESVGPGTAVAVFGIDPDEDAPRRAAHAAVAIRQMALRARRDNPSLPDGKMVVHSATLTVARGDSEVGIDPEGKREAHAALDALVARAEPGSVVISASAAGALGRHFDLELLNGPATERAYRLVSFAERPQAARASSAGSVSSNSSRSASNRPERVKARCS
jgi:DNA-binding NtrC family response regulator